MVSVLRKGYRVARPAKAQSVSLRGFGGGWNAIDDDISMNTRFQKTLKNFFRTPSGAQQVRWGTQWFADISTTVTGANIVDMEYYNGRLLAPTDSGQIATINDAGAVVSIWDNAKAALLPGVPTGWGAARPTIDFVPFKNKIILHNGVDKPIIVDSSFNVTYLQDDATGSNTNVPIGKYGCVVSNYHCIAGIPGFPTTVYVSSQGTAGVFPGDPAPNDSISFDVGAYAPDGAAEIRGIAGFRNYLIVYFRGQALLVTLGIYVSTVHTPSFPDTLPRFGLLGHRCITNIENDLLFADFMGINSGKRNLFSGLIDSEALSDIVAPPYQSSIGLLSDSDRLNKCFSVYDDLSNNYMLFTSDGKTYVRSASDRLRYSSWSEFEGQDYQCACKSFIGRVFFGRGMKVFQQGNDVFDGERYYADRMLDRDAPAWVSGASYVINSIQYDAVENTSWKARVSHTASGGISFHDERILNPAYWEPYAGEAIDIDFELPWQDGKDLMRLKQLRFIRVQTKGDAVFTLELYLDNLYKDVYGRAIHAPALSMELTGNELGGYGAAPYGDTGYGGGKRSADPRLRAFPAKFMTAKFRIIGSVRKPLQIISISFIFSKGAFKR